MLAAIASIVVVLRVVALIVAKAVADVGFAPRVLLAAAAQFAA
jgi:hypothetical protein